MIKPRIGLIFRRRTLLFSERCRSSSPLIICRYHIRITMKRKRDRDDEKKQSEFAFELTRLIPVEPIVYLLH